MSIILGVLGFLLGILAYIGLALVAPLLDERRYTIANVYEDLASKAYRRPMLEISKHGDVTMRIASYDDVKQADEVGEENYYQDANRQMTRWRNKPFGIVFSEFAEILAPQDADIAQRLYELQDSGGHVTHVRADGGDGQQAQPAFSPFVSVPTGVQTVDMRQVSPRMVQSYQPGDPEKCEEDVKKSQIGYKERSAFEMVLVFFACGIGMGGAWLIWSNSGAGSSTVSVPIQLAAIAVGGLR